jgi:hypothetical protein
MKAAAGRILSGRVNSTQGTEDCTHNTREVKLSISPPAKEVLILRKGMLFNLTYEVETASVV